MSAAEDPTQQPQDLNLPDWLSAPPGPTVQLILADSATVEHGKVYMLGGGWARTNTPTQPFALVAIMRLPWSAIEQQVHLKVHLLDEDGRQVPWPVGMPGMQPGPAEFQVLMPIPPSPGEPGIPVPVSLVFNLPSLPLRPGRYTWRASIGEDVFTVAFQAIAPAPAQPGA